MGDAKRRKQLGLMPTVYPFEVELDRDGTLTEVVMPGGEAQRQQIAATLRQLPTGAQWDQFYRTDFVSAGLPEERLITREDVEKIAVPPRRRIVGELATWPAGNHQTEPGELKVADAEHTWLRLRSQQHAFENQPWQQFPELENTEEWLGYLFQHPALQLEGEVAGRYSAEQTADGQLSWTPEPPEEQRAALDDLARRWHGETPDDWAAIHAERLGEEPESTSPPQALRSAFELRQPSPLRSFLAAPFDLIGELEVFPDAAGQAYSLDNQTWQDYPVSEPDDGEDFGDFTDVETFSATVWEGGRMAWPVDALDADAAQRLTADLLAYTGADDAAAWASYTGGVLTSFYELEPGSALPHVQAIKISVPNDLYEDEEDSDSFEAQVIEDEISFDGQTWHDLYEDLPDELNAARADAAVTDAAPQEQQ